MCNFGHFLREDKLQAMKYRWCVQNAKSTYRTYEGLVKQGVCSTLYPKLSIPKNQNVTMA